ncbi:tRNA (adenosine(37)-N6)-dimethylallyltransferase MiaA [Timonella sp. A28]|uniref:tRNA (adenosine(37)-N6)-dimethylallyltransferase MiaA n=1 Tax=Timonella sp. A28 TaxID=3442640 RepID=UPI003EC11E0A
MDIIAVVGPTATGKSDLALDIAEHLGGTSAAEIINADAYQLYTGMDIGTAKVAEEDRRGITHHQLDVLDVHDDSSVAAYQTHARKDIAAVHSRHKRPILVGGSGLYVRAVLDEMTFPGTDAAVRETLEEQAETLGTHALYQRLLHADPAAAHAIGSRNTRRIVRALEVIELTGKPYSANLPRQEYVQPTITLGLDYDREALDQRIEQRVDIMLESGLVEEVRGLVDYGMGRTAARAVGYAEIIEYLQGNCTLDEAKTQIITNTRRLTRKQMGWFGRDPRIQWLDAQAPHLVEQALDIVHKHDQGLITHNTEHPVRRSLGS